MRVPLSYAGVTAYVEGDDMPVGAAYLWPTTAALPADHLVCDGSAFDPVAYPALAVLYPGHTVPDFRRVFVAGADDATLGYHQGDAGGADSVVLGLTQIPAHNHGVTDPQHTHASTQAAHHHGPAGAGAVGFAQTGGPGGANVSYNPGASILFTSTVTADATPVITVPNASTGVTTNNAGGGLSHENRPSYLAWRWIMRGR